MKKTQLKVENVFGDMISEDHFSQDHINKPKKFY